MLQQGNSAWKPFLAGLFLQILQSTTTSFTSAESFLAHGASSYVERVLCLHWRVEKFPFSDVVFPSLWKNNLSMAIDILLHKEEQPVQPKMDTLLQMVDVSTVVGFLCTPPL